MNIYDGLPANLSRFLGFFSIGSSLGGLYLFHSTPATYTLALNTVAHWGGLAYFSLISILQVRYLRQKS